MNGKLIMQMEDSTEHDEMLMAILKDCKTLPVFLNHVFGFLYRSTDFYETATDAHSSVGLPQGLAEKTVKEIFYKWKLIGQIPQAVEPQTASVPSISTHSNLQNERFSASDCYNGASYDNYSWSQSILEVDVVVKLSQNITVKDVIVDISSTTVSVKLKDGAIILEGLLCDKCRHNDAIWSLQANTLNIHLDKCKELWWNCLFKNEPRLDVNKLDCTRPFEELPEEAQAKINELQWNQERKRLNLPTSEELTMQSVLKKSWNAEGSPFTGPFDPSSVKFS